MKPLSRVFLIALFTFVSLAKGAEVVWTVRSFDDVSRLSTQGKLIEAYKLGANARAIRLNGIDFAAGGTVPTSLSAPVGDCLMVAKPDLYNKNAPGNTVNGLTPAQAGELFGSIMYVSGAGNNRLTLGGLTDGERYVFEFLVVDDRLPGTTMDVGHDSTPTQKGAPISTVKLFSGAFTATGTTQTLLIANKRFGDNNVALAAYQLRAVSESVPEVVSAVTPEAGSASDGVVVAAAGVVAAGIAVGAAVWVRRRRRRRPVVDIAIPPEPTELPPPPGVE